LHINYHQPIIYSVSNQFVFVQNKYFLFMSDSDLGHFIFVCNDPPIVTNVRPSYRFFILIAQFCLQRVGRASRDSSATAESQPETCSVS